MWVLHTAQMVKTTAHYSCQSDFATAKLDAIDRMPIMC